MDIWLRSSYLLGLFLLNSFPFQFYYTLQAIWRNMWSKCSSHTRSTQLFRKRNEYPQQLERSWHLLSQDRTTQIQFFIHFFGRWRFQELSWHVCRLYMTVRREFHIPILHRKIVSSLRPKTSAFQTHSLVICRWHLSNLISATPINHLVSVKCHLEVLG